WSSDVCSSDLPFARGRTDRLQVLVLPLRTAGPSRRFVATATRARCGRGRSRLRPDAGRTGPARPLPGSSRPEWTPPGGGLVHVEPGFPAGFAARAGPRTTGPA